MKGCATSIIIHFNSVLVFSCAESCDQQSQFLILIGSKIIQHNKREVGFKIRFRPFKTTDINLLLLRVNIGHCACIIVQTLDARESAIKEKKTDWSSALTKVRLGHNHCVNYSL